MMKPFQTYIYELSKPYEFRIKLAGVNPQGEVMDKIKHALESFQLESVSPVKSLPIQEHREFPQWGGPCECWQFDVKVAYPATTVTVRQLIKERAQINLDCICVRNLNEANYTDEAEAYGTDNTGALLEQPDLKCDADGQPLAGQSRIGSLLKELESRKFEYASPNTEAVKDTNSVPTGSASPMTQQNKMYNPLKGKK